MNHKYVYFPFRRPGNPSLTVAALFYLTKSNAQKFYMSCFFANGIRNHSNSCVLAPHWVF